MQEFKIGDAVMIHARILDVYESEPCYHVMCNGYTLSVNKVYPIPTKTYEDGVREGQMQAWETARRIIFYDDNVDKSGLTDEQLEEIFGTDSETEILKIHTAQEAAAKIKAWEDEREIHFRDEVIYDGDDSKRGVVTKENITDSNKKCCVLWNDGEVGWPDKSNLTRTGRSIDITGLLAKIGGAE